MNTKVKIVLIAGFLLLAAAAPSSARTMYGHVDVEVSEQVADASELSWWKLLLQVFFSRYAMAAN